MSWHAVRGEAAKGVYQILKDADYFAQYFEAEEPSPDWPEGKPEIVFFQTTAKEFLEKS